MGDGSLTKRRQNKSLKVKETCKRGSMSDLFTVGEAAKLLDVHPGTVRRWIELGVLDAIILPHVAGSRQGRRIKRESLEKALRDGIREKGLQ
jgi:excisionase family DNA binding protein